MSVAAETLLRQQVKINDSDPFDPFLEWWVVKQLEWPPCIGAVTRFEKDQIERMSLMIELREFHR